MNNMQNEGIPDISSLGMGNSAGVGNNTGAKNYNPNTGNLPGKGGTKFSGKQLMILGGIVVAFAVIVIILLGVRGSAEREVEKVVNEWREAFLTFDYTDISWDKYYPDEIAEELEEQLKDESFMEEMQEAMDEIENYTFDFLAVSKLDRQYEDMLVDIVREFADELGISLKKKDIDVSVGYIVIGNEHVEYVEGNFEYDMPVCYFVIKVNGRYGVYASSDFTF